MSTLQEKIAVMQAFERGEKIERKAKDHPYWNASESPLWNWEEIDFRIAKPEPKKIKLLAYLSEYELRWLNIAAGNKPSPTWKHVPSEDKEITLP